jgi:hypothetical protein
MASGGVSVWDLDSMLQRNVKVGLSGSVSAFTGRSAFFYCQVDSFTCVDVSHQSYLREDREEAWFNGTGTGCYQAQSAPKFEVGSTWTNSMECAKWCIHQQEAHGLL